MSLIHVLLVLVAIGVIMWLVITYLPLPDRWKKVIIAIAVICVILWLLQVTGLLGYAEEVKLPTVK